MENPFTLLIFGSIFLAFFLGWQIYHSSERELDPLSNSPEARYQPFMNTFTAVYWMLLFLFRMHLGLSTVELFQNAPYFWAPMVLDISLSYLLLVLLMPVLHKFLNARTCAVLWLVPALLYLTHTISSILPAPALVIPLPAWISRHLGTLGVIWFSGAILFLVWRFISHLLFRHRLLADAYPEEDKAVQEVWHQELQAAGLSTDGCFHLPLRSPMLRSPLSIGFTQSTTRVVLPEWNYTPEELHLIFRHELIHIGRRDCVNKFFLAFYTAICWFNPLVWLAARKGADELELSCDESVLLHADQAERDRYAGLLLRTAGEQRGFTTCLSASASALRFRLRNVVRPSKKLLGWGVAALSVPLLILSAGHITVSYGHGTGEKLIFNKAPLVDYQYTSHSGPNTEVDPLIEYLAGLEYTAIAGQYSLETGTQSNHDRTLFYRCGENNSVLVTVSDLGLVLQPVGGSGALKRCYLVEEPINWNLVNSLVPTQA